MKSIQIMAVGLLAILSAPVMAQTDRYPTNDEIRSIIPDLKRRIPELQKYRLHIDDRTPAEQQQRESLVTQWQSIDPSVAPFLGYWMGYEESIRIYPSSTQGKVCIINQFIPESEGTGYSFELGTVDQGSIRTARNQALVTFELGTVDQGASQTPHNQALVTQQKFLGIVFVDQGQAQGNYIYSSPRLFTDPPNTPYLKDDRQVVEQFRQNGCLFTSQNLSSTEN